MHSRAFGTFQLQKSGTLDVYATSARDILIADVVDVMPDHVGSVMVAC
jgi:exopolysaccharide biosynthesis protein